MHSTHCLRRSTANHLGLFVYLSARFTEHFALLGLSIRRSQLLNFIDWHPAMHGQYKCSDIA